MKFERQPWHRSATYSAIACLVLTFSADWLFYGHEIGWNVSLFGAALIAALCISSMRFVNFIPGRTIFFGLLGLLFACFIEPGGLEILLGFAGLLALASINRVGWTASVSIWMARLFEFMLRIWIQLPRDYLISRRRFISNGRRQSIGMRLLSRWSIPVFLTLVFLSLFWLANPIISNWISNLGEMIENNTSNFFKFISPLRMIFWLLVMLMSWGLLRVRTRRAKSTKIIGCEQFAPIDQIATPSLVTRCLILFNALFVVQTLLDIVYLWSGTELPEDMTYAEYAHRGAYPLIATALLAGGFVLMTFRSDNRMKENRLAYQLVYLWIGQNVFLTISAVWRLWLYVEVYSLSRLRLAAAMWMVLITFGLITIIWRLIHKRTNVWLVRVNVVATIAVLYGCCFINTDGFIASFNVKHCSEMGGSGGLIDLRYLSHLGPTSIPAFETLIENVTDTVVVTNSKRRRNALLEELEISMQDWRGWTWRRSSLMENATAD